jgi:diacylglycerol kinase
VANKQAVIQWAAVKRIQKSFGYSMQGLRHAIETERNLQLFIPVYVAILLIGVPARLLGWEWLALIISGSTFISVELLNTCIERLTDVLDDEKKVIGRTHYHAMLKAAKDVGAAASLISLVAVSAVIVIVFYPYALLLFHSL